MKTDRKLPPVYRRAYNAYDNLLDKLLAAMCWPVDWAISWWTAPKKIAPIQPEKPPAQIAIKCEYCNGTGAVGMDMNAVGDVVPVQCPWCGGGRTLTRETIEAIRTAPHRFSKGYFSG